MWKSGKWQDLVLGLGAVVFVLAILPLAVQSTNSVPRLSSLATSIVLGIYAVTTATMGLRLYATTNVLTALLWLKIYWSGG